MLKIAKTALLVAPLALFVLLSANAVERVGSVDDLIASAQVGSILEGMKIAADDVDSDEPPVDKPRNPRPIVRH